MNVVLFLCIMSICFVMVLSQDQQGCIFHKHNAKTEAIQEFEASDIYGKRYSTSDGENEGYTYSIGICTKADIENNADFQDVGISQTQKANPDKHIKVGKFTKADFISGTDWIFLEYGDGDNYHSHCGDEERRGVIMIVCDPNDYVGTPRILEEQNNKTGDCFYLFEISHHVACSNKSSGGLSAGSILLIIFFSIAGIYLLLGFIYQRFIVGAKGWEQIPNFSFWQDFGNLQSDGCDFFCRSGSRVRESRQYRGIGDDQLQDHEEQHDDNLLPM